MSPEERLGRLAEYLLTCFDADELRRILGYLPDGTLLANSLPSRSVSAADITSAAVRALDQGQYLQGREFWDSIRRARPRRADEINRWEAEFRVKAAPAAPVGGDPDDQSIPEVLEILLVSATPIQRRQLAVDVEFARIIERLRHRNNLHIEQRTAVTFDRLQAALVDLTPHILHICCHGDSDHLFFQPAQVGDPPQEVPKAALIRLLSALGSNLRLVVVNACESLSIAEGIVEKRAVTDWAIGMTDSIVDADAINFSVAFYDTLAAGRSLDAAFQSALARLMVGDPNQPQTNTSHEIPRLVPDSPLAKRTSFVAPPVRAR